MIKQLLTGVQTLSSKSRNLPDRNFSSEIQNKLCDKEVIVWSFLGAKHDKCEFINKCDCRNLILLSLIFD